MNEIGELAVEAGPVQPETELSKHVSVVVSAFRELLTKHCRRVSDNRIGRFEFKFGHRSEACQPSTAHSEELGSPAEVHRRQPQHDVTGVDGGRSNRGLPTTTRAESVESILSE